jgi:hypothetical protein
MVASKDYDALPLQRTRKVSIERTPFIDTGFETRFPFVTEDYFFAHSTGYPGDTIDWHSHDPSMYQIMIGVKGTLRIHYVSSAGDARTMDVEPRDFVYLPGGLENKLEVIGDVKHTNVRIQPNVRIPNVERLLGDGEALYHPDDRLDATGLWYDTRSESVVKKYKPAILAE